MLQTQLAYDYKELAFMMLTILKLQVTGTVMRKESNPKITKALKLHVNK